MMKFLFHNSTFSIRYSLFFNRNADDADRSAQATENNDLR